MLRYNVRSRQLVDIVGDIKRDKLIISPYFQRKLVWREIHKIDFIKTILLGYPFPEIFIAKGDLDVENMTTTECVVDGQQRLNSIRSFINNNIKVDGKFFKDLTIDEKEDFLKYEVAIIDLDLKHDDPQVKEIFKRLNRTFYSLSYIEKLSTEYAPSEIMLVSKLIAGELNFNNLDSDDQRSTLEYDPEIPPEFIYWAKNVSVKSINKLILETPIFSNYETSRQIHLLFSLNIIGSIVNKGIYTRNIPEELLNNYAEKLDEKEEIVGKLEAISKKILAMKLKTKSYWYNKANMFTLLLVLYNNYDGLVNAPASDIKKILTDFEDNLPSDYQQAAKEGVNNKKERLIRERFLSTELLKLVKA